MNKILSARSGLWFGALGLWAVIAIAFAGSLHAPYVFDDVPNLASGDAGGVGGKGTASGLPDLGETLAGRPVARWSFQINQWLLGAAPWSFRAGNILIHSLAAIALFAAARGLGGRVRPDAPALVFGGAWFLAAWWALHPLQTAAVTYIIQRVESLAGLWVLISVASFLRSLESPRALGWKSVSVATALAAAATKESTAALPLVVLLLDRTFVSGTFAAALRARRGYYGALAGSWVVLASSVIASEGRGGTAGFDAAVSAWTYLLTQADALVRYLGLTVWPHPLIFDYGTGLAAGWADVWWQGLLVLTLLTATIVALVRVPRWGFAGAWFFAWLAPSSSFVPIASQTMAEHRVYLALAAPLALLVAALAQWLGPRRLWFGAVPLALALAAATMARNEDYASAEALWADTVAKRPQNARARINLAFEFEKKGRQDAARAQLEEAIRQDPHSADAHYNLGLQQARAGQTGEARRAYERALALRPDHAEARNNLGSLLLQAQRWSEAAAQFRLAVQAQPSLAVAHSNLAAAQIELGHAADAARAAREALRLQPDFAEAAFNLGNALAASGDFRGAGDAYERAVKHDARHAGAHANWGNVAVELGELPAALRHYEAALAIDPQNVRARRNAAAILAHLGRRLEALRHYEELARQLPHDRELPAMMRALREGR